MSSLIDQQIARGITSTEKLRIDAQTNHLLHSKYTVPDDKLSRSQAKRHKATNENSVGVSFR